METSARSAGEATRARLLIALAALALPATVLATFLPARGPIGDDPGDFSIERAALHLAIVAAEPRPNGSEANARVREHIAGSIRELGLEPLVQTAIVEETLVHNVLVRLPGAAGAPSILFVCHYDSRPETPGAGDDGAAVAALLECLRALRASPTLERDLLFLFTDGEELDLLGAKAFATSEHVAGVALVLNFEAIGNAGPAVLFETGPSNGRVVREFARGCPHAVGSSLGKVVYDQMSNDTDFTEFRELGLPGLNFALCCGSTAYHQPADSVANLSRASLGHMGSVALSLARHFGGLELDVSELASEPDAVFFNVWGPWFATYPSAWALPLSVVLLLACSAELIASAVRRAWSLRDLLRAAGRLLCAIVISALIATLAVSALDEIAFSSSRLARVLAPSRGNAVSGTLAFLAIAGSVLLLMAAWCRRFPPHAAEPQVAVARLAFCVLCVAISAQRPGASYVFLLPATGSLLAASVATRFSRGRGFAPGLAALGPFILFCPPTLHLIYMLASRARLFANWGIALALAAFAGLLLADLGWASRAAGRRPTLLLSALVGLLAAAAGIVRAAGS